ACKRERAKPTRSAPIVIAFAASTPVFIPPDATIGALGNLLFTETIQSFVGSPQTLKASSTACRKASSYLNISTLLQEVPPAPATSIYETPASYNFSATVPSIPKPTSFAPTSTESPLQTSSIFGSKSLKFKSQPS